MKLTDKTTIQKILVISLSNIGDVILTFPVMDILREDFPRARISVVAGPKAQGLFSGNPHFDHVYAYDKQQSVSSILRWLQELRRESFDLVVDLRNTAIPFLIGARHRTSFFDFWKRNMHMKEKHLQRLRAIYPQGSLSPQRYSVFVPDRDRAVVNQLLNTGSSAREHFAVAAPGAANPDKRWAGERFRDVCRFLAQENDLGVLLVGDEKDRESAEEIRQGFPAALNLCGRLSLIQLAEILSRSLVFVGNDSAPMHLASYLDRPVLAVFGPSDPRKYGPWSSESIFVQENGNCRKCREPKSQEPHICMQAIESERVCRVLRGIIAKISPQSKL